MNHIAFVFSSAPHGTTSGREGLDALLATSSLTDNIGVFFIGDGVFQLLPNQKPERVLARDYISTFKALTFCEVQAVLVCAVSLHVRGLGEENVSRIVKTTVVSPDVFRKTLSSYNVILNF